MISKFTFQSIVATNGAVYYTTTPPAPISNMPIDQFAAAVYPPGKDYHLLSRLSTSYSSTNSLAFDFFLRFWFFSRRYSCWYANTLPTFNAISTILSILQCANGKSPLSSFLQHSLSLSLPHCLLQLKCFLKYHRRWWQCTLGWPS